LLLSTLDSGATFEGFNAGLDELGVPASEPRAVDSRFAACKGWQPPCRTSV